MSCRIDVELRVFSFRFSFRQLVFTVHFFTPTFLSPLQSGRRRKKERANNEGREGQNWKEESSLSSAFDSPYHSFPPLLCFFSTLGGSQETKTMRLLACFFMHAQSVEPSLAQ
mmetsp:Transcript_40263/g.79410  ORF Transcript_40263/g.79410 Transcript_40263/m.79410 type:complete len:113 (+) Transcript_40263:482-820(+)